MRLYLVRHGQSYNNELYERTKASAGRMIDPHLTDIGVQQAQLVARHLATQEDMPSLSAEPFGITHIYCSAMLRALQTAQPISDTLGLTPEVWVDVHESGGMFELQTDDNGREVAIGAPGLTRQEIVKQFANFVVPDAITDEGWWNSARGMETIPDFLARAVRVALRLRARADTEDRIVIVAHGGFIDALLKALLNQIPTHPNDLFYMHYNTSITRIDFHGDGGYRDDAFRVHYINRVDHLPQELRTW